MSGVLGGVIASLAGKRLTYITQTTTNSVVATTVTITHPAEVQVGDLMVVFYNGFDNDAGLFSGAISGFTNLYLNNYTYTTSTSMCLHIFCGTLTNLNSITTTAVANEGMDGLSFTAYYFRPNFGISTLSAPAPTNQNSTGAPGAQTVTVNNLNTPVIVFGASQGTGSTISLTSTPAFDVSQTATASITSWSGFKLYNSAPQNHTIGSNDSGTANRLTSFYLQVA